jgi:hypothetical protein
LFIVWALGKNDTKTTAVFKGIFAAIGEIANSISFDIFALEYFKASNAIEMAKN